MFLGFDLVDISDMVASKVISAREVVSEVASNYEAKNQEIGAFVTVDLDRAFDTADRIDQAIVRREIYGRLLGVPFGVKDLEDVCGFTTSKGSALYRSDQASQTSSIMVERLIAQGAIVVGKTNTPEFGLRSETFNAVFGDTRNPLDLARTAGGSSGGSAAAISGGLIPLATGSDGGGSIRIPSAACGISGFKCSVGLVPVTPSKGSWIDLSSVGPMAATLKEIAYVLDEVVGVDERDFRSRERPFGLFYQYWASQRSPVRILASKTLGYAPTSPEVSKAFDSAVALVEAQGIAVEMVEDVLVEDPLEPFMTLALSYTLFGVEDDLKDSGWELIEPQTREWLGYVTELTAQDLLRAQGAAHEISKRVAEKMQGFDLLMTPTCASIPPTLVAHDKAEPADANWVRFTYPFNLTRAPAATVPFQLDKESFPIGVQLVGRVGRDLELMAFGGFMEALFSSVM